MNCTVLLILVIAAWPLTATRAQEVKLFSGTEGGEGLDLEAESGGKFVYAINFGGTADLTIRGLTFEPDTAIGDLSLQANDPIEAWEDPNTFGNSSEDTNLATLLHSMRWATFPAELSFELTGLDSAAAHKLQLLFVEKCCQRGFDILVDETLVLTQFSPDQLGASAPDRGVVVSVLLDPGPSSVQITLRGNASDFPDPSPVIQAATLEQFSKEPDTTSLNPPTLRLTQTPNTNVLTWLSNPGRIYQIEYSETLGQTSWLPVNHTVEGNGNTLSLQDSNPARIAKAQGFYRLLVE